MKERHPFLCVDKEFHRLVKSKAAEQGVSIITFSKAVVDFEIDPLRLQKKQRT